jgi:hypothetical protein
MLTKLTKQVPERSCRVECVPSQLHSHFPARAARPVEECGVGWGKSSWYANWVGGAILDCLEPTKPAWDSQQCGIFNQQKEKLCLKSAKS